MLAVAEHHVFGEETLSPPILISAVLDYSLAKLIHKHVSPTLMWPMLPN